MALPSITDDDIAEQMKMMAAFQNRGHLASGLPLLRRVHERGTYFVPGLFDASVLASLYTFVGAMVPPTRVYQALEADEDGKPICLVSDYGGPSVFLVAGCVDAASPHPRAPHLRAAGHEIGLLHAIAKVNPRRRQRHFHLPHGVA